MNPSPHSATADLEEGRGTRSDLLGIYLNDHLAGATGGVERARHLVRSCRGTAIGSALDPVATEIAQDRESLLHLMQRLDIPPRRYKICAGWAAEKLGRLKGNGRLMRRSPLSSLIDLELLRIGVAGKTAGWETLRRLSDHEERLDPHLLDALLERARGQLRVLESLHLQQVTAALQAQDREGSGAR
ncbi:hypothetical protein [Streptomyces sp. NPDC001492]